MLKLRTSKSRFFFVKENIDRLWKYWPARCRVHISLRWCSANNRPEKSIAQSDMPVKYVGQTALFNFHVGFNKRIITRLVEAGVGRSHSIHYLNLALMCAQLSASERQVETSPREVRPSCSDVELGYFCCCVLNPVLGSAQIVLILHSWFVGREWFESNLVPRSSLHLTWLYICWTKNRDNQWAVLFRPHKRVSGFVEFLLVLLYSAGPRSLSWKFFLSNKGVSTSRVSSGR